MAIVDRKYLPATLLRLQIRLEDFTKDENEAAQTEDVPFKERLKSLTNQISVLTKQKAELHDPKGVDQSSSVALDKKIRGLQRSKKQAQGHSPQPASQTQEQGDDFSIDITVAPVDMSLELNGARIADTMTAKFPFRDAPLVSDIIRSALVEVWAGTVPAENFAKPDRWSLSINPGTRGTTLMFRGYVDSWDTDHSADDARVEISARSLEAILIDGKMNPMSKAFRIKGDGEKISVYINRILAQYPPTSGKTGGDQMQAVWYAASKDSEPVLSRKSLLRSLQTAQSRNQAMGAVNGQPPPIADDAGLEGEDTGSAVGTPGETRLPPKTPTVDVSIWDLITQACNIAGCIPVYDPSLPVRAGTNPVDNILLRPPQTMFEGTDGEFKIPGGAVDNFTRDFTDPISGAKIHSDIRFMVWGHNIKSLRTSRKLGRIKAPAIEINGYNGDANPKERAIVVRYPNIKVATRVGRKGEAPIEEVITKVIRGTRDKKMLKQIAVGLYHALSRQELSVKITTDDLASYIDPTSSVEHNDAPDLLRLRPGSPCRVTVAREVKDPSKGLVLSPLSEVFEKRTSEISRFLLEQEGRFRADYPPDVQRARAKLMTDRIATALTSAKLTDIFYCRTVSHTWSADEGWASEIDLVNFLEARALPKNLSPTDHQDDQERREFPEVKTPAQVSRDNKVAAVDRYDASLRKLL